MATSDPLFPALVPARSMACSMVSVVRTPKSTGTTGFQHDLGRALGHLAGDIVEMGRRATDNRTEHDHCIILARFGHLLGNERNFKGTGAPGQR